LIQQERCLIEISRRPAVHLDQGLPPVVGFDIRLVARSSRPTVVVRGYVDLSTSPTLAAALDAAMSAGRGIELDLRGTTFMDSAGVVALLDAHVRLGQVPEAIVLLDPSPAVRRILELAEVEGFFSVVTSPQRVLAAPAEG
jgi:anti-sigma B factor antagonist